MGLRFEGNGGVSGLVDLRRLPAYKNCTRMVGTQLRVFCDRRVSVRDIYLLGSQLPAQGASQLRVKLLDRNPLHIEDRKAARFSVLRYYGQNTFINAESDDISHRMLNKPAVLHQDHKIDSGHWIGLRLWSRG